MKKANPLGLWSEKGSKSSIRDANLALRFALHTTVISSKKGAKILRSETLSEITIFRFTSEFGRVGGRGAAYHPPPSAHEAKRSFSRPVRRIPSGFVFVVFDRSRAPRVAKATEQGPATARPSARAAREPVGFTSLRAFRPARACVLRGFL